MQKNKNKSQTDAKFLEKCVGLFQAHPHFRPFNGAFQIKHYAGDVTYNVEGMSDKNKDTLFSDLIETMQTSANPFLVSLFPEDVKTPQKKRPTTAGFKIKVYIYICFISSTPSLRTKNSVSFNF